VRVLGRPLPSQLERFLRSWDGAELFQESVRLYGVENGFGSLLAANTTDRPAGLRPRDLVFGDTSAGELLVLDENERVVRLRGLDDDEGAPNVNATWDERWLSGTSLEAWIAATVTHDLPLYDSEGEFVLEAFEEDGLALVPNFALKLARKVLKKDPESAELHHALGVAERRNEHISEAAKAFSDAAALDPKNPWIWFDLGRSLLELDAWQPAAEALGNAAKNALGSPSQAARFYAWQAVAYKQQPSEPSRLAATEQALVLWPTLQADLQKAAAAAVMEDDRDAYEQLEPLLDAFVAVQSGKRLALLSEPTVPPPQQKPLPRPAPARKPPPAKRPPVAQKKKKQQVRPKPKR